MHWIVGGMKWIMLISGVLTCTMLYAAISPQATIRSTFGGSLEGPVADIVVRNFGRQFLSYQAGVAVVSDSIQISLFAAYLIVVRRANKVAL